MKTASIALLALVLSASAALAASAADQFAGMYGNTVTVKHNDGQTSTVFINPDHTWEQRQGGQTVRGTYEWKDATHYCMTVTDPKPGPNDAVQECEEMTGNHKVGDTWKMSDGKGHDATLSITAGRQ